MHEANVRNCTNEIGWGLHDAARDDMAPKLLRVLELLENLERASDVHRAVGLARWRVAQFANAGMTSACVVPTMGGFLSKLIGDLKHLNLQAWLQALEHDAQIGRHDAAADEDHIGIVNECLGHGGWRTCESAYLVEFTPFTTFGSVSPRTARRAIRAAVSRRVLTAGGLAEAMWAARMTLGIFRMG